MNNNADQPRELQFTDCAHYIDVPHSPPFCKLFDNFCNHYGPRCIAFAPKCDADAITQPSA